MATRTETGNQKKKPAPPAPGPPVQLREERPRGRTLESQAPLPCLGLGVAGTRGPSHTVTSSQMLSHLLNQHPLRQARAKWGGTEARDLTPGILHENQPRTTRS